MKKSFMTRALATGLSLAMALSLSVADTSIASAAAKKASVTSMMKVSSKSVTEGKKVTTYMNSTATKKYRIKSHTETATAKKYISVVMTSNRKGLTISAKDGAVTAANLTKKGVNVKINFAPATSVAKVKKAAATKYVNLKVVVNAKPEEKLTMTAEATGVKKIAVTFNKAVDTTATKIVVKKGSATPTIASTTFASDAKSAEIVMGTKLTEGTYTVEATVGEDKLTADIAVQNEKMTAFQLVSKNLVADPDITTKATISYKAVNQYGEMMAPGNVQATCSFGAKIENKAPTADKVGTVTVSEINTALAIVGTTGTLVLVDTTNGVNLNETVTYQSKAIASAATIEGIYSEKTEKLVEGNLKVGTKTGDYWILMNIQNQYGDDMNVEAIAKSKSTVSFNPASVLTNLSIAEKEIKEGTTAGDKFKDINYNGKTCVLVKLAANDNVNGEISKAGTLNLTIVSSNKGVLANPSFTVDDKVVISSFSVSPADTVYAGVENKLIVDATDANGNAVTKYDDLNAAVKPQEGTNITLKKNADGTGTFYYKPTEPVPTKNNKYKDSTIGTLIFNVNDNTSGNYMVKTVNVTIYAVQKAWKVAGTTKDTVTAVASGAAMTFDFGTLNYEDQYGNTINYDTVKNKGGNAVGSTNTANIQYLLKDDNSIFKNVSVDGKKLKLESTGTKGSATLYLQYNSMDEDKKVLSEENYDIKVTLSVVDVTSVTASDLTLKINDGKTVCGIAEVAVVPSIENKAQATTSAAVQAVVTGKVGGKTVVIPAEQFTVTSGKLGNYGTPGKDGKVEKTETKTVTVVVDSENGPQILTADVTVSNAGSKATKIEKANDAKVTATTTADAEVLADTIKVTDQYGLVMKTAGSVVMTVTPTGKNSSNLTVTKNATQVVSVTAKVSGEYTASVKYDFGGLTLTQDVTLTL